MFRPMFFLSRLTAACALVLLTARCGGGASGAEEPTVEPESVGQSRAAATSDELRYRWTRFVRASVQPRLVALGVSDAYIRRAVWFGLSEGIYTIGNNTGYGQPNGRQSPIGFSNCGDRTSINSTTAFPDCFGALGIPATSGNWQVGIAGAQVSDHMPTLPQRYRALYGELPPKLLGQSILRWLGETVTFPDIPIDSLAQAGNSRWASVILRDPALNVYTQTFNSVIRGTSNIGLFKEVVDAVWNEAAQTQSTLYFSATNQYVVGQLAQYWQSGSGRWACWAQQNEICLATWGIPISGEYGVSGSIPGTDGHRVSEQRFERALLQINWYSSTGNIVQGALLGSQRAGGKPGNPSQVIDPAFRAYYLRYGGLPVFGYALEPAKTENGRWVQYFERARLEAQTSFNPNNADPVWEVQRGLLGVETK